ncbi:glucose-1-phosphate adenylyltransferase large subunit 1, chloroplastic [Medicago truncatula]|uniref:glucose-1-phosphate adenylyltransferase large subunit 1, chloroplastic n=1 Tax=Medicago truncatula TaxID=3880 RepID=UPI00196710BF|nr:glucose-1-phosphate adenylyltransferase large subunit 1, chloroplastic-like [Medicago truncatula]
MLSSTVQLREPGMVSSRNLKVVKFCNGEMMGRKIELHAATNGCTKNVYRKNISMSLTADVASESKLKNADVEKRDPSTVVAVILGGGAGTRSNWSAYRLIDVPMSNCINSGINKVYILTQFNSASLNRHIARAYNSGTGVTFGDGYVEVLAATQTPGEQGKKWFQGTADAVRQFHWLFEDHRESGADIIFLVCQWMTARASDFGLMKIDDKGRILSFSEKPKGAELKAMQVDTTVLGLSKDEALEKPYIASMGVYVFKKEILLNLLRWRFPTANDFGSEVIPASAKEFYMKAYLFNDYWEDIGTIRSFFDANLALTEHDTMMLGADYYETGQKWQHKTGVQEADRSSEGFYIRSGITVVLKNSTIEDGLVI